MFEIYSRFSFPFLSSKILHFGLHLEVLIAATAVYVS